MPDPQKRSPYLPWPVIDGGRERRVVNCFACDRFYGAAGTKRELTELKEPVKVGEIELKPGWYCPDCLGRALRPEPPIR